MAALLTLAFPAIAVAGTPGEACRDQAAIAEQSAGIPPGLLLAIGKRESGASDAATGTTLPWPWAVNRDGAGRYLASPSEAVSYVRGAQAEGAHSVDVGCFQISLLYHPFAFSSLEEAFDPAANAAYAAKFLTSLRASTGSWESAVAAYHSADPSRGGPYRDGVLATWHGVPGGGGPMPGPGPRVTSVAFRTMVNPLVMGMHVWTPGNALAPAAPARRGRMPAVVVPAAFTRGGRT